jgi:hypothetical protein
MNSPIDVSAISIGDLESCGEGEAQHTLAALGLSLNPAIEYMRDCPACGRLARFIAEIELVNGLFGTCANCGDQRVVRYTRTVPA